jgi:alanine transaminase
VEVVRRDVAKFIGERDGYPSDASQIFLTNGASPSVQYLIQLLLRDSSDGVGFSLTLSPSEPRSHSHFL